MPVAVEREACENFVELRHQPDVLDALRLHGARAEIAKVVVVLGGDRQLQLVHFGLSTVFFGSMASFALATMSAGACTRSATRDWTFVPATGVTSSAALFESSR